MKQRQLLAAVFCLVAACLFGCTQERDEFRKVPSKMVSPHGTGADSSKQVGPQGFVGIVARQKLPPSDAKTIGEVFEEYRYFSSREWKETPNATGRVYVDFKGLFEREPITKSIKDGVVRQGLEVKFVVEPTGNFYIAMVSRIDIKADGKMYLSPLEDGKKLVEMMYANKEIHF